MMPVHIVEYFGRMSTELGVSLTMCIMHGAGLIGKQRLGCLTKCVTHL